jgi:hypothetical protein
MARTGHLPKTRILVTSVTNDWVLTHSSQVLETGTLRTQGCDSPHLSEPLG